MMCYVFIENTDLTYVIQKQLRCGSEVAGLADWTFAYI